MKVSVIFSSQSSHMHTSIIDIEFYGPVTTRLSLSCDERFVHALTVPNICFWAFGIVRIFAFRMSSGNKKPPLKVGFHGSETDCLWSWRTSQGLTGLSKFWNTTALATLSVGLPRQRTLPENPVALSWSWLVRQRIDALTWNASLFQVYCVPITTAFWAAADIPRPSNVRQALLITFSLHT